MKVSLVAVHQISFSKPKSLVNCLGVLTLAAELKEKGITCNVIDLKKYHGLDSWQEEDFFNQITDIILQKKADIYGFSTMSDNLVIGLEICRRVKQKQPSVKIVLGGPGVSFCARDVLNQYECVDFIFRGEGDQVFPEFVMLLEKGVRIFNIKGIVYRGKDQKIIDNGWPDLVENLDELPVPLYDLCDDISEEDKTVGDYNGISIEAGRGCPFNCSYCSTSVFFKRKHRLKSVDRIIQEIDFIQSRLGNRRIIFHHDLLTLNRTFVSELCENIKSKFPRLIWKCHVRLNTINYDVLKMMREAGCNEIFMGIESATDRMQKVIKKRMKLSNFDEVVRSLYKLKIRGHFSFIVGFPEERREDIRANLDFALRAMALSKNYAVIKIHTLVPTIGSDLFEKTRDQLHYDEYGSYGTTEIPTYWNKIRGDISENPNIFSMFHYIDIGSEKRLDTWKYSLLGLAIGKLMPLSMRLAYGIFKNKLADILLDQLDHLKVPAPDLMLKLEYWVFNDSLIWVIRKQLSKSEKLRQMFEAIALFENAKIKVENQKDPLKYEMIRVWYDPNDVALYVTENKRPDQIEKSSQKIHLMIFWEVRSQQVKVRQVQKEFLAFLGA